MIEKVNPSNYMDKVNPIKNNQLNNLMSYPGYGVDFQSMLQEQLNKNQSLQFSKHAMARVEQRGIEVTPNLMDSLNDAVAKAKAKGAKDIVIIGEKEAFIINIPNNVVVTTMSGSEMKENIFTNIDSAVIL